APPLIEERDIEQPAAVGESPLVARLEVPQVLGLEMTLVGGDVAEVETARLVAARQGRIPGGVRGNVRAQRELAPDHAIARAEIVRHDIAAHQPEIVVARSALLETQPRRPAPALAQPAV